MISCTAITSWLFNVEKALKLHADDEDTKAKRAGKAHVRPEGLVGEQQELSGDVHGAIVACCCVEVLKLRG